MYTRLHSFIGGRELLNDAVMLANNRLLHWMWLCSLPSSAIRLMTTTTQPFVYEAGLVWHHTITVLIECEHDPDPDHKLLFQVSEAYKPLQQHPLPETLMPIPQLRPPDPPQPVTPPRRGRYGPRTEAEERMLIAQNNIRCLKLGAYGELVYEQWKLLCDCFGNKCLKCGSADRLSIDHVVPVPEGNNLIDNIQPLCRGCNSGKRGNYTDYRRPDDLAAFLQLLEEQ